MISLESVGVPHGVVHMAMLAHESSLGAKALLFITASNELQLKSILGTHSWPFREMKSCKHQRI